MPAHRHAPRVMTRAASSKSTTCPLSGHVATAASHAAVVSPTRAATLSGVISDMNMPLRARCAAWSSVCTAPWPNSVLLTGSGSAGARWTWLSS
ncbi:hypothetical protein [Microbispora sp. GKU 823]|uniref:hypothetical protein n=1 Tax=Microbispora sp. GKU 823 TaxID=1652100 RepID=UPI00211897B9|nr:hypothetical protein [Microbispora sp. GKU 823]